LVVADDTLAADRAYRLACEGTALLWQGDFQNARQLLQALARRADKPARKTPPADTSALTARERFHLHRQAQAQRARTLGMLLIPLQADHSIALRRAPDLRQACLEAWGDSDSQHSVTSLRELLGVVGAHEWRKKGVEIAALGAPPHNRIHAHYGVFSPVRGEYLPLVAQAPLPHATQVAFDIGVGTGVLSAVLARRGVARIVATDVSPRALACAQDNLQRLGLAAQVQLQATAFFPEGQADLIVCNPPWVPARAQSPLEQAVYDDNSQMLKGFLASARAHLLPGGEAWLILSDLAEHLGLRTRAELLQWIEAGGLRVVQRLDTRPQHGKSQDPDDPLHAARAAEVTSLWRLQAQSDSGA
jgi:methylase of polypeptide subunit release factors